MFTFIPGGIMLQANPAEGNKETSDTPGFGVWQEKSPGNIVAKFVEVRVDYKTQEVTRGVVEFQIKLQGQTLKGDCQFNVYDIKSGQHIHGPHLATLVGKKVNIE